MEITVLYIIIGLFLSVLTPIILNFKLIDSFNKVSVGSVLIVVALLMSAISVFFQSSFYFSPDYYLGSGPDELLDKVKFKALFLMKIFSFEFFLNITLDYMLGFLTYYLYKYVNFNSKKDYEI